MNLKDAAKLLAPHIDTVKKLFSEIEKEKEEEKKDEGKYMEEELEDGTKLKISGELVSGSKVEVVSADGSLLPAPDGTHKLKSGKSITTKDGLILEVKDAEVMKDDPKKEDTFKTEEEFKNLKSEFETLKNQLADFVKANQKLNDELIRSRKIQEATFKAVEALAGLPAGAPIEDKQKFLTNKEDKLAAIRMQVSEIKKIN